MKKFLVIDQNDDVENVIVLDPSTEDGQRWLAATQGKIKEVIDLDSLPEIEHEQERQDGTKVMAFAKPGIGWKKEAGSFRKLTKEEKESKDKKEK